MAAEVVSRYEEALKLLAGEIELLPQKLGDESLVYSKASKLKDIKALFYNRIVIEKCLIQSYIHNIWG